MQCTYCGTHLVDGRCPKILSHFDDVSGTLRAVRDTQPRTLSGIPRVEGVAPETPAEDIRNALAILFAARDLTVGIGGTCYMDAADFDAIVVRLNAAINKLEQGR